MTPARRSYDPHAFDAHLAETVAWRAPSSPRFDGRPSNDWATDFQAQVARPMADAGGSEEIPRWVILLGGAFIAAILGALLGGAMHVGRLRSGCSQ